MELKLTMYEKAKIDPLKIPALLQTYKGSLAFKNEEPPYFLYQKKGRSSQEKQEEILEVVKKLLTDFSQLKACLPQENTV